MPEYAVSTNLISWVPAKAGFFGWPQDGPEAEVVESMVPGDFLIPKFAQTPYYTRGGGSQIEYVKAICKALALDYEEQVRDYEATVAGGQRAVPFLWRVVEPLAPDRRFPGAPWNAVRIDQKELTVPYSTGEFLRLRAIPIEIARQFKATAAQGRRIQQVASGTVTELDIHSEEPRTPEALRNLLLVKARGPNEAFLCMRRANVPPRPGDYLFLVQDTHMPGFYEVSERTDFLTRQSGQGLAQSAEELIDLVQRATERAVPSDGFRPGNMRRAAEQLLAFVRSGEEVERVEEFSSFYDRFVNLTSKVSQALEIAERDLPPTPVRPPAVGASDEEEEEEDSEQLEEDNLRGLTVSAVEAHLDGMSLPPTVLADAVTAIRAGKHVLLSGPPGTGKSAIAAALSRAVVGKEFQTVTATADWTTFDTIGGYMPQDGGTLEFEPGIVLRSLERGQWLVVDELNRADIDKAFGPLFTLLANSGEGGGGETVTLPFRKAEKNIRIVWRARRGDTSPPYVMTPTWRLIGTLNVRDKASLFQLSFAFLRRFAVVDVPLPGEELYRVLVDDWLRSVEDGVRGQLVDAAMRLAFSQRQLGPAILKDIAAFVRVGVTPTETVAVKAAYSDPVEAFLTAVRLYAVPQYEGAVEGEAESLLNALRGVWPEPPAAAWEPLEHAFKAVALG
ncbi:MAG TPA: AAA family ATPase [Solirubrobacterales bacterium]|nr:AAA family ATPase [Solirubrobacterales bacterium]